jgi:hypothetical protein
MGLPATPVAAVASRPDAAPLRAGAAAHDANLLARGTSFTSRATVPFPDGLRVIDTASVRRRIRRMPRPRSAPDPSSTPVAQVWSTALPSASPARKRHIKDLVLREGHAAHELAHVVAGLAKRKTCKALTPGSNPGFASRKDRAPVRAGALFGCAGFLSSPECHF